MTMRLIFWILMLLWLVSGCVVWLGGPYGIVHWGFGINTLLAFILFLLLGWKVFGRPVQDA